MRKTILSFGSAVALLAAPLALSLPVAANAADTDLSCKMSFTTTGWSVLYKTAKGSGTVTCSNGQTAKVRLKSIGGGLVVGKSTIDDGKGDFSGVKDISNIYGDYAAAQGEVGAVKSAEGTVVSKGEINLALSGTGRGWDLGVSFSKFSILPYASKVAAK
ncbi:MAG: hypothetical protein NVS9B10_25100 [Nevskia sp.]